MPSSVDVRVAHWLKCWLDLLHDQSFGHFRHIWPTRIDAWAWRGGRWESLGSLPFTLEANPDDTDLPADDL